MGDKRREGLKRDIEGAMYDLMLLKGHTPAEAKAIVENTIAREENITEHALARFLVRLDVAHRNRGRKLPEHWAGLLRESKKKNPEDIRKIREEIIFISKVGRQAAKETKQKMKHAKAGRKPAPRKKMP